MTRKLLVSITTVLYLSILMACQSSLNVEKNDIGNQIEKNLVSIIDNHNVLASSNPAVYIKGNPELYEEIINTGDKGLEFLVNELKNSSEDGLKEWLMAKACEDIVKDEQQIKGWSTGKEYESLKK